jgi:hypothetical protein
MQADQNKDREIALVIFPNGKKRPLDYVDRRNMGNSYLDYEIDSDKCCRPLYAAELVDRILDHKPFIVPILRENEAKALISKEYGFEYNMIELDDICWYDARDYNHFEFRVRGWHYVADDFGPLTIVRT